MFTWAMRQGFMGPTPYNPAGVTQNPDDKADEVFVALLKRFTEQHQMVSHNTGRAYAPARFAEHPEAQGISKKEFAKAMQRLLDAKVIEIRTWGRPSRQTSYLALVVED
jgi:hypothetical protein